MEKKFRLFAIIYLLISYPYLLKIFYKIWLRNIDNILRICHFKAYIWK